MLIPTPREVNGEPSLKHGSTCADEGGVDAPCRTKAADLANLRDRLDDLGRRRIAALGQPAVVLSASGRRQLEAMRFELAEVERHLAQLEVER